MMGDPLDGSRSLMASHNPPLHAMIVPSEDYHQSEYVSARDKRREFVSGFSGSAGLALVTKDDARLWTDGRYFLQATQQLSDRWKLMRIGEDPAVETWLADVAWLYNVRGSDVSYCPVVHAFAIVTTVSAFFYVDKMKISTEVHSHLEKNGIQVCDYDSVSSDVALLASGQLDSAIKGSQTEALNDQEISSSRNGENGAKETNPDLVWLDSGSCCYALYSKLNSRQVLLQQSPLALPKAVKNPVELDGLRKAHIRDGAAVVQYLVWLDKQMQSNYEASGYFIESEKTNKRKHPESIKLTEVSASDKLESFRASKEHFKGLSFPTISSVGPNAAIIHYQPEPDTCAELDADKIYLFDSGAQYQDGTTDITRTVHFGKPSAHEKACYTAVLKGHIALDTARFPNGTNEHALDILARVPLWKNGLDYRHGTGHGIGSYLNVHEGPHLISFRPQARNVPLQASMTATDEPGYYEDGNFGIRLENVLIVNDADTKFNFGDKGYLSFEHITWAPYQIKMMDTSMLVPDEIEWVNTYHSKCREILAPFLDESEMTWLKNATEPISV
ncbi:aminopeptidase P1-like isoform X3 [Papaver somniferum]|uniref:aminopeptidase P1-like isoform X3 n=1 Tax=Papaver somniferum TaxID=3469 RepID=UPI000E6F8D32|nr:aminopeptidase P1-like isoform X3 [Papaver somniferum]